MKTNNLQEQVLALDTLTRVYNSINSKSLSIVGSENCEKECTCKSCKKREKVSLLTLSKIEDILNGK